MTRSITRCVGYAALSAVLTFLSAASARAAELPSDAASLCHAPEAVVFSCAVSKKKLAICHDEAADQLSYRFGVSPAAVELEVAGKILVRNPNITVDKAVEWEAGANRTYYEVTVRNKGTTYGLSIEQNAPASMPPAVLTVFTSKGTFLHKCIPGSEQADFERLRKLDE